MSSTLYVDTLLGLERSHMPRTHDYNMHRASQMFVKGRHKLNNSQRIMLMLLMMLYTMMMMTLRRLMIITWERNA